MHHYSRHDRRNERWRRAVAGAILRRRRHDFPAATIVMASRDFMPYFSADTSRRAIRALFPTH